MHTVLVTGGCGFLGQHVVKHLQLYGENIKEIRILDFVSFERKLGKLLIKWQRHWSEEKTSSLAFMRFYAIFKNFTTF